MSCGSQLSMLNANALSDAAIAICTCVYYTAVVYCRLVLILVWANSLNHMHMYMCMCIYCVLYKKKVVLGIVLIHAIYNEVLTSL